MECKSKGPPPLLYSRLFTLGNFLYTLIITLTVALTPTMTETESYEDSHLFRTKTGCYLAGAVEAASFKNRYWPYGPLPKGVTIDIECEHN